MPRPARSPWSLVIALALIGPLLVSSISHAAPPEPTEAPRITETPPVAEAPSVPAPTLVAPSCPVDDSLSLTGSNLWDGLRDKPVVLALKNGNDLTGSVVEQSSEQLALVGAELRGSSRGRPRRLGAAILTCRSFSTPPARYATIVELP